MYIPKFSQMIYNKLLFNALNKMKMYIKMSLNFAPYGKCLRDYALIFIV